MAQNERTAEWYKVYVPPQYGWWVLPTTQVKFAAYKKPTRWAIFWHRVTIGWRYEELLT